MIYHLSLQTAGYIAGLFLSILGLWGLVRANASQAAARSLPRSRVAGFVLFQALLIYLTAGGYEVIKALELFEKEADIVILPPFYYGAASYAVAAPQGSGTVQVGGNVLAPFAE